MPLTHATPKRVLIPAARDYTNPASPEALRIQFVLVAELLRRSWKLPAKSRKRYLDALLLAGQALALLGLEKVAGPLAAMLIEHGIKVRGAKRAISYRELDDAMRLGSGIQLDPDEPAIWAPKLRMLIDAELFDGFAELVERSITHDGNFADIVALLQPLTVFPRPKKTPKTDTVLKDVAIRCRKAVAT